VIGSGIAGLSTAYELSKRGKSVMVIDRGGIAGGMTSRTSAHLAPLCDDLVSEMTKIKGQEVTKLFCNSQAAAVDRIEEIQSSENIDCDFRRLDSYLFQGQDMPAEIIDQEMDAVRDVGAPVDRLVGVQWMRDPPCAALSASGDFPSPEIASGRCEGLPRQRRGIFPRQPGGGSKRS
jgi:glycine/D-amino acid oxidase-like deaminating enzyme